MTAFVTAGLDGSPESLSAADWAAREALLRDATLRLVQVRVPHSSRYAPVLDAETEQHWAERVSRETVEELTSRYPSLRATTETPEGQPPRVLTEAAADSALLVVGSRGLGSVLGFLVGSVALPTVAHAPCPVVVVRAHKPGEDTTDAPAEPGDIVLGLDLEHPADELLGFAFDEAGRRQARLRVLHGWDLPPAYGVRPIAAQPGLTTDLAEEKTAALNGMLQPWREKYPGVEADAQALIGRPARHLVESAPAASLVVVGRRMRRHVFGTHIGAVAHSVLHHADAPVAVVPHG
ncbi:universal stress protein [Streptomyces sp. JJ36]|uniref:universal stress protein n=1 Tax=Streptomyces sp. JJ36 TaxID=2736645 RepID=UPI001F1AF0FF|nr:universal stress protein [Streptomyces sp. JJ36]MCF6524859.1 universal stress protein [Streptomyces sp. JJ36]